MTAAARNLLNAGADRLRAAGIDNPRLEARLLLAHAAGTTSENLLRDMAAPVAATGFDALIARRMEHEPLAHILGNREFWSLDFAVSADTLIPRPESETLIEAAVAEFAGTEPPGLVLDLGTGTGCLLLAALHEFPGAIGIGVDRHPDAACLAARNAAHLGMADRASFVCGDWASALRGRFDLVLCNPPYIATAEILRLIPDVARFEPRHALDGGCDGFAAYRRVLPELARLLTPCGVAILELGIGQADMVTRLAMEADLAARSRCDLTGITRALTLRRAMP